MKKSFFLFSLLFLAVCSFAQPDLKKLTVVDNDGAMIMFDSSRENYLGFQSKDRKTKWDGEYKITSFDNDRLHGGRGAYANFTAKIYFSNGPREFKGKIYYNYRSVARDGSGRTNSVKSVIFNGFTFTKPIYLD